MVAKQRSLVYGVGVNDWPSPVKFDGKVIQEYQVWRHMLSRCYEQRLKDKYPTYHGVTCVKEWLSFSKFIEDISSLENYDKLINNSWHLDKDILVKGNKVYSKETCCFVPPSINALFPSCKKVRGEFPIGVNYDKVNRKFRAQLSMNKKKVTLGLFDTSEKAFYAYKKAKESYIKSVAINWKGIIANNVYDAMMNYTVDFDD